MTKGVIIIVGFWWLILGLRLYLDLKEWNRQRLINEQKARNLLSENIELELTEEEAEALKRLSKGNTRSYLRKHIKDLCN